MRYGDVFSAARPGLARVDSKQNKSSLFTLEIKFPKDFSARSR